MAKSSHTRRRLMLWALRLTTALVGVLGWVWFSNSITGQDYEFALHDAMVRLRGPLPPPQDVVIVALDESSYRNFGLPMDRPLPRSLHARLLKRLAQLGARRVLFDIVFAGESASPEADAALAESVGALPVVLGVDHGVRENGGVAIHEVIKPEPFLTAHAESLAVVGIQLEEGAARRFFVQRDESIKDFPSLSEAGVGLFTPEQRARASLPTESDLINYYGPGQTIRTISVSQVLEEAVPIPAHLIKDKIVYVGLLLRTGLGATQKDSFQTPFGDIFGVEIHATQAANILTQRWVRRPSARQETRVGGLLLFLVLMVLLRVRPQWAGSLLGLALGGWFIGAYLALQGDFFLAGASAVTVFMPLAVLISSTYWYLTARRRQMQIEKAFSLYVSPAMVGELKRDPSLLKLGGAEVVATAVFTDIAGFTSISEQLGASRVTAMLNTYFTAVSDAIMEEGGTVIKFIGDAVFALWGAPIHQPDHAARACRAAMRIQEVVDDFNAKGEYPPLLTRVGVNTGKMMVGNLGSSKRFDFTAIGDAVNISSRVEGVNKYLGTNVLVTADTLSAAQWAADGTGLRMGAIRVVGKEIPVDLFRLSSEALHEEICAKWKKALALFTARRWVNAEEAFRNIQSAAPELSLAADLYLTIIEDFKSTPPKAWWRGELVMEAK